MSLSEPPYVPALRRGRGDWFADERRRETRVTDTDILAAWNALHDATPPDWLVGRPAFDERRDEWSMYAWSRWRRRTAAGLNEWTVIAPTQERVLREMARCLVEVAEGRVPR